jgi:uncharacterized damage-inducible protein DinB
MPIASLVYFHIAATLRLHAKLFMLNLWSLKEARKLMQLTLEELVRYTDEERAKWEAWFKERGDEPLGFSLCGDAERTVGALILHMFGPELQYVQFIRDEELTDYTSLPTERAAELFAFGRRTREGMRAWCAEARAADWEREFEPNERVSASARKITAHVLMHEIRHWAQIALVMRQHGLEPPGDHDLLFSEAME